MNSAFPLHLSVVASREQVSCDVAGEAVILSLKDGIYYSLNEVGAKIWTMLQERHTLGELCEAVALAYPDVEPARCERDVLRLLQQMAEWELVEFGDEVAA